MGEAKRRREQMTEVERRAEELTKELANKGLLVGAGWAAFELHVLRDAALDDDVRATIRTAFFAGAQHLYASIMTMLDENREPTSGDLARMQLIDTELGAWAAAMAADNKLYPTRGSA